VRFVVLTQYYPPECGAPQTRLAAVARELVRAGHEVEVVTALPNYPAGRIFDAYRGKPYVRELRDGITVHRTWLYAASGGGARRMLNYASFTASCVAGLLRVRRPDYLFVESPPLFLSVPAWLMAHRWGVPVIFNVADLWPDSVRQMGILRDGLLLRSAEKLEAWTYRAATFVNAVTEGMAATLIRDKQVPPEKVLFLPNGADTTMFRPMPPDAALAAALGVTGKRVILYAGTVGYAQGLDVALEAMEQIRESDPGVMLLIVGGGSDKPRLQELAAAKRLPNVKFLDPVDLPMVNRLYSLACAGLATLRDLPLFDGARPSKILPAMAAGKPVLYSGRGEGARLVTEASAGLVTPPENAAALAGAIRRVTQDAASAADWAACGRRYVEEHLSWEAVVARWLAELRARANALPQAAEEVHAAAAES